MLAFVLSGGGNRGALQVGALQVLLEAGLVPDMVVGSSVGAINGAYIAFDPTVRGAQDLTHLWEVVTRDDLYPGNHLTALWSMIRGKESLFSNLRWQQFLNHHIPCRTFGDLQTPCYVTATELGSGEPALFGDDPGLCITDALMASCALPPLHPPYRIGQQFYIDGGATVNLPLRFALEKGATQIYALNIVSGPATHKKHTFVDVSARAVEMLVQRQIHLDLEHCASRSHVRVRQINLIYRGDLEPWDFSRTTDLIQRGRDAAEEALAQGPLCPPTWQERLSTSAERLRLSFNEATAQLGRALWPKETVEQPAIVRTHPSGD